MQSAVTPLFHHCTSLGALLKNEPLVGHPEWVNDSSYHQAYVVWAKTFGFYPLFFAMGRGPKTIEMTGYPNQFGRVISSGYDSHKKKPVRTLRPKGEMLNNVLLSFEHCDGIAHKFDAWNEVLCWALNDGKCPRRYVSRLIQQSRRSLSYWCSVAQRKDGFVQMCAERIDPKTACRVWVRNLETKRALDDLGYRGVEVRRVAAPKWWP